MSFLSQDSFPTSTKWSVHPPLAGETEEGPDPLLLVFRKLVLHDRLPTETPRVDQGAGVVASVYCDPHRRSGPSEEDVGALLTEGRDSGVAKFWSAHTDDVLGIDVEDQVREARPRLHRPVQ